jgi:hypothetical protein
MQDAEQFVEELHALILIEVLEEVAAVRLDDRVVLPRPWGDAEVYDLIHAIELVPVYPEEAFTGMRTATQIELEHRLHHRGECLLLHSVTIEV